MTGWIIYGKKESELNKSYIDRYIEKFDKRGIRLELKLRESLSIGITQNDYLPDFAIVRTIDPILSRQLELLGVRVFNNSHVSSICNSKAKTYQYMHQNGIDIPETYIGGYSKNDFPVVMKPNDGHGGKNVVLAHSRSEYEKYIDLYNGTDFVVQKCVTDIGRDLRVYVVGKNIIAAMLRESKTDFRSNFCLGGSASVYNLSCEETKLIGKIISLFDFDFVGIDFIFDNGKIIFNEIEDVVGSRMIYTYTNIDIVDIYVNHIIKETILIHRSRFSDSFFECNEKPRRHSQSYVKRV